METAIIKPEDYSVDLTEWNALSIKAERISEAIEVNNDTEEQMAIDSLSDIKRFQKQVEDARKSEVDPFNKLVKRINDIFRPIGDGLAKSEETIKGKIKAWRIAKEEIRRVEERKQMEEYQKKIAEEQAKAKKEKREAEIIVPPPAIIPTQTIGTQGKAPTRKVWKFEVVDETKIPRQYLVIDEVKIRAAIKSGLKEIDGLRIYEDIDISVRPS
jgi:hypothetical protein